MTRLTIIIAGILMAFAWGCTPGGNLPDSDRTNNGLASNGDADYDPVVPDNRAPGEDFTEEAGSVSFDMVYVPGGTFTIGCESGNCPADTTPVSGVRVSSYYIAKNQVTPELYDAVMGESSGGVGPTLTWYDAMEFACRLSQMTSRNYRMPTEAEWEYAAKNHLSSLEDIGDNSMSGEEWAYNSWSNTHMGGTDPVGPSSGEHTQKTRRDVEGTTDYITGRLIRSIDGIGPALRLVISDEVDFPPGYVPPCNIHHPELPAEPVNSYRDPRWITGSEEHWTTGSIAIGSFELRVWEDGTARLNGTDGQWFTSNNIAFVFVPSSGSITKFAYIFLDKTQGSVISDQSYTSGGFVGRIVKELASGDKPTISGLKSGAELAAAAGDDYKMVDMENIPESAKEQDPRLLDGANQGWFQDNTMAGGLHHYRKDIDPDEFRFTVNQGQMIMLANGKWFTVNNTFLRITHSSGYTTDYLYTITPDGTFYHNSYQAYERGDFRMFQLKSNSESFPDSCGAHCSSEIPKGEPASVYANLDIGKSTFVPAPYPSNPDPSNPASIFAVNCGGSEYTSSDGTIYKADTGYSGGSTYSNTNAISGTTDDTLYQSERYGDLTYSAKVPNGDYLVILHFAETYHTRANARSFNVLMEGEEVISNLDLYAQVGGNTAYVTETHVTVNDGEINIEFDTNMENAKINAIKVTPRTVINPPDNSIKSIVIEARGFTFDALESGPADGEPVLLLHGFPDTSLMWTNLMKVLADNGYHCLAPDQRGYSPGARPTEVDAYRYEELIADGFAFGKELGDRYHLLAHDWGANIAWLMLEENPSPIASFTSLAVPHYQVWARAAHENEDMAVYRTLLDIWMTPGEGEAYWTPEVMRDTFSAKPADLTEATIAHMMEPGAMTAALNWYRASDGQRRVLDEYDPWQVNVPTLVIFGTDDMGQSSVADSALLMTGPYRVVQPQGSHFIVDEQPQVVAAETLTHLQANPIN